MIAGWEQNSDELIIKLKQGDMTKIPVRCPVRSLKNGLRDKRYVAHTFPDEFAYDPDIFPIGKWSINAVSPKTDAYKAPYFIATDAYRYVNIWDEDESGYVAETNTKIIDTAFGMHCSHLKDGISTGKWTLGCIMIINEDDCVWWAETILKELESAKGIPFWVTG